MSQFMFNPTGAALTNPTDPLSSLAALERRKQEMAQAQAEFDNARARARAKREAAEAARRPASVEAPASAPSAPAPAAAPAAKPNASTSASAAEPDKYSLLRKAAQDRYQAELSRMADVSTSGGVVPPLSSKRAGQRYENELNRLEAIQAMERDRAARREALVSRVNERKAAQAARRAQIAAMRQRENADIASQAQGRASDIIQAAQSVNPYAMQDRQFLDRLLSEPKATNPLRAALSQTPTGRLMDLATSPIEQFGPGAEPGEPIRARSIAENDYLNDLRDPAFGDPTYMGPRRPSPNQPDLTDLSAADPLYQNPFYRGPQQTTQTPAPTEPTVAQAPRPLNQLEQAIEEMKRNPQPRPPLPYAQSIGSVPRDPALEQASGAVSERYRRMGVDPMDPAVYPRYSLEVQRELQNMGPTQMSAPVQLPPGKRQGLLSSLAESTIGPGGLLGPPLPPDLANRAVDMAPTEAASQEALVQQLRAQQQGALIDALAGVATGLRGPSSAPPTDRTGRPRFPSGAEDAPDTVVPGVRPRDLPSSTGPAQQRPFAPPTRPLSQAEPTTSQVGEPVQPQTRQQKSDARLKELNRLNRAADIRNAQQDAVDRIIEALAEAGMLPDSPLANQASESVTAPVQAPAAPQPPPRVAPKVDPASEAPSLGKARRKPANPQ